MKETLLVLLFTCHWLADYTWLSTSWMLNAKRFGKPLIPIAAHAGVHALSMGFVLHFYLNGHLLKFDIVDKLILFQFGTHFLIDVWKGRMNGWFPLLQSPANKLHWVVFGLDQLLHAIVIITMVYFATNQ